VGTLLDTTVLIRAERLGLILDLPQGEDVGIAAITASELIFGVHRADPRHRAQRAAFVEHILRTIDTLPFDLQVARVHARLWSDLNQAGTPIGPNDLLVAATALAYGWALATHNVREFSRVPGLTLRPPLDNRSSTP
jgi:tRNA(fMet)-specific endonuclease VapC